MYRIKHKIISCYFLPLFFKVPCIRHKSFSVSHSYIHIYLPFYTTTFPIHAEGGNPWDSCIAVTMYVFIKHSWIGSNNYLEIELLIHCTHLQFFPILWSRTFYFVPFNKLSSTQTTVSNIFQLKYFTHPFK